MIRAAALGRIDYTKADSENLNWITKERLILEDLAREQQTQYLGYIHSHYLAAASGWAEGDQNAQLYQTMSDKALQVIKKLESLMSPWDTRSEKERMQDEATQMRQRYKAAFKEDPDSESAKRKVKEFNKQLELKDQLRVQERAKHEQKLKELKDKRSKMHNRRNKGRRNPNSKR